MFMGLGLRLGAGGIAAPFGASLKSLFPFPVGQAVPTGYTSGNATLPFGAAQAQFDATVFENAHKPENLLTTIGPPRVYSMASALALEAASPMPVYTFHSLNFPNGEASGFVLSSLPADPNYWKTDVTARVNQIAAQTSNFAAYPVIEIGNELVAVDGTTGHNKFAAAAAADATWGLDPLLHLREFYDAVKAVNTTARLAVGDFQIEDAGYGFGVNPRFLSTTAHTVPGSGIATARKRPQIIRLWQTFLAARPHRGYMRMQGHFDASQPFYREELDYFLDELYALLRVDVSLEEVNAAVEWSEHAYPSLTTTALKRRFAARHAAYVARAIADRCGLQALIGWTGFGTDGRTRLTIMENGVLSELGEELRTYFAGWSSAPQAQYRAMRACELGTAGEAGFLPYWSGITTMGWGAYGSGGAMSLDMTGYKMRTADGGALATVATTNASHVVFQRLRSVASGMVLFDMKASGGASFIKAQTNASGRLEIILDSTTFDLGVYAAGDLVKTVVDHNGTTALRAVLGRYTAGGALVFGAVVTRNTPTATQIASIAFPEASGEVRTFYHSLHYGPDRLATPGAMLAMADPTPVQHVAQSLIEAVPAIVSGIRTTKPAYLDPALMMVGEQVGSAFVSGLYPSYQGATVVETAGPYTVNGSNVAPTYVLQSGDLVGQVAVTLAATGAPNRTYFSAIQGIVDFSPVPSNLLWEVPPGVGGTPAAFVAGNWSIANAATNGDANVTITALPSNGGSALTNLEYRVAGGSAVAWGASTTGTYGIPGLPDGTAVNIEIRAVNANGPGPWSDVKSVTTTGVPDAFTAGQWTISDAASGGDATLVISALPAANGSAITALQRKIGAGAWTSLGGTTTGTYALNDLFTDGAATNVLVRAVNAVGNGPDSDTKSVTTTAPASPPAYFGRTSATPSSSAISVAWPASHAVNDVGLLLIPSGGDEPSTQDLSGLGWTSLGLVSQTGPTTSAYRQIRAWWKRAASTAEPSVSLNDTGAINGGDIFVIRGCRTTGDPVALLGQSFGTSASLQVVIPTANTSGPQRFILGYFTLALDSTTAQMAGGYSNANLTSLTNRLSNQSVASIGIGRYSFDGVLAAQGAVGNTTGTIATDGLNWVSALFEFIP